MRYEGDLDILMSRISAIVSTYSLFYLKLS